MEHAHSILVVDDDPTTCQAMVDLLVADGYRARKARDGREALRKLQSGRKPCLLLLDLMMPGMTGWELLELHRENERLSSVPLVLVTGWTDTDIAQAKAMIPKPLDPNRLLRTLRRILARESAAKAARSKSAKAKTARPRSATPEGAARSSKRRTASARS
jgi:CheY-like chemotaxis protein